MTLTAGTPAPAWTPLVPWPLPDYLADSATPDTRAALEKDLAQAQIYKNSRYVAIVRIVPVQLGDVRGVFEVLVRRHDRRPLRDWRDLQRVKNELFGPLAEGVELYPAETRLIDIANVSYLYVLPPVLDRQTGRPVTTPQGHLLYHTWPIGYATRLVSEKPPGAASQRPFPADYRPHDLVDITPAMLADLPMVATSAAPPDPHPDATALAWAPDLPALVEQLAPASAHPTIKGRLVELALRRRQLLEEYPPPRPADIEHEIHSLGAEVTRVLGEFARQQPAPGPAGAEEHTRPEELP